MSTIPILQIRQQPGRIGMDADLGQYSIRQPKADLQIKSNPALLTIDQHQPELIVDSSRAKAAFTGGPHLEMTQRLYSNVKQIFLEGIAKRVEEGNRMAEFFKPGNTIVEVYGKSQPLPVLGEFRGEASIDNVDVRFNVRPVDIEIEKSPVEFNVQVNKPEIEYNRGKLDIYMMQYPSVEFIPPEIDRTV
ncbi:DUF6470 family protein [Paenibacillus urinalis]|uniref:DUF6470 family protein n=1 Tax=Paenibacillus urinalis TaxID=521520 RepID=A0ABY7X833_9BACL|nr:DUF6470 family protein [Paenibacillus urinalis]WDH98287.1 DUF6470 family protein [Paenibacillus urinalis]WDI01973.1 DUF6470 family protein [Paenibacillus urinalis]